MKTVIRKQHDDGVVAMLAAIECRQNSANLVIHKRCRREIRLHRVIPLFRPLNPLVSRRHVLEICQIPRVAGDVGVVVLDHRGQLDLIARMKIEPFFRGKHRHVWSPETDGQEERFVVALLEPINRPVGDFEVRHLLVAFREGPPVPKRMTVRLADLLLRSRPKTAHASAIAADLAEDLVASVVEDLADAHHRVTFVGEAFGQRLHSFECGGRVVRRRQEVDAGRVRVSPRQQARTRRIADRRLAMRVGEQRASRGKRIDRRSLGLWMTAHAANPVVEIVHRDQQDVASCGLLGSEQRSGCRKQHG